MAQRHLRLKMNGSAETRAKLLEAKLEVANAENVRLNEENASLRQKLHSLKTDSRSTAALNLEARMRAFDLEDERDRMFDNLERVKKKYNELHEAYLEKVNSCVALEAVVNKQKTLTRVVESYIDQNPNAQLKAASSRRAADNVVESEVIRLEKALDKANDTISDLEFELESLEYFEIENQRLKKELASLKARPNNDVASFLNGAGDDNAEAAAQDERQHDNGNANLNSAESLEMDTLTARLIRTVEAENHALRRQYRRCQPNNTTRPPNLDP